MSCDLTNELVEVVDQYFDTNQFDFTTNYFQAYDVELTNGLNTITLTVSDLAGNVTTTNVNVTLDYTSATNPPVLQVLWPTNGAHLSGESFYLRGLINDETARVTAQIVDAGVTNEFAGLVERNGTFWVENLPLAAGTNAVTLRALDAAGNLSTTNLSVVQSRVTLTILSTPEGGDLYAPSGDVYGTVSDLNYTNVSVNGVAATVDQYGYWWAENVPNHGRGTATFDAVATASGGGGAAVSTSVQQEMPATLEIVHHHTQKKATSDDGLGNWESYERTKVYNAGLRPGPAGEWLRTFRGTVTDKGEDQAGWWQAVYAWTSTNATTQYTNSSGTSWSSESISEDPWGSVTRVPDTDLSVSGTPPLLVFHYFARKQNRPYQWPYGQGGCKTATVEAKTEVKLYTGGKAGIKRRSLIHLQGWAEAYDQPPETPWLDTPTTPVEPTKIQVLGWCLFRRHLDAHGELYLALPDNEVKGLRLRVPGLKHYTAGVGVTKHKLVHETKRCQKGVSPEWRLVKAAIIAGSAFTVTAAVGDFHELAAGFVEQGKGFETAFDGTRFRSIRSEGHQIARQGQEQVRP